MRMSPIDQIMSQAELELKGLEGETRQEKIKEIARRYIDRAITPNERMFWEGVIVGADKAIRRARET